MSELILAGDIGGTKTYLALFHDKGYHLELAKEGAFSNSDFKGPDEIIGRFIKGVDTSDIEASGFGIACPVVGNRCKMTNLDWIVDGEEIKRKFNIRKLELINDLVAIAWGVDLLSKNDLMVLQEGTPKGGNAALIAAGTGLGEAILFWDGVSHIPSGSEGGHTDFAPRNQLEMGLLEYLMKIYGHVSYERILSGPGLENIYNYIKTIRKRAEPQYLKKRFEAEGIAPVVSEEAISGKDETCREALELFISIYGAEAGNLALKSMAVNGIYIGGGIVPKILKAMESGTFIKSFRDKGRFDSLMSQMPVNVILNDKTGLLGAAAYAAMLYKGTHIKHIEFP